MDIIWSYDYTCTYTYAHIYTWPHTQLVKLIEQKFGEVLKWGQ